MIESYVTKKSRYEHCTHCNLPQKGGSLGFDLGKTSSRQERCKHMWQIGREFWFLTQMQAEGKFPFRRDTETLTGENFMSAVLRVDWITEDDCKGT